MDVFISFLEASESDAHLSGKTKRRALRAVIQYFIKWASFEREEIVVKSVKTLKELGITAKDIRPESMHQFIESIHACLRLRSETTIVLILNLLGTALKSDAHCKLFLEKYSFTALFEMLKSRISDSIAVLIVKLCTRYLLQQDAGRREFSKTGGMKLLVHLELLQMTDIVTLSESGMINFLDSGGMRAIASLTDRTHDIPVLEFSLALMQYAFDAAQLKGVHRDIAIGYLKSLLLQIDLFSPKDQRGAFETHIQKFLRALQLQQQQQQQQASKSKQGASQEQSGVHPSHPPAQQPSVKKHFGGGSEDMGVITIKTPKIDSRHEVSIITPPSGDVSKQSTPHGTPIPSLLGKPKIAPLTETGNTKDITITVPQTANSSSSPDPKIETDTLAPLIKMLTSFDAGVRAEAVVLVRKLASRREIGEDVCLRLTEHLIPLMDEEDDHVQVNCCIAILSMSTDGE
ncbi:hypothetical protein BDR26DRAFT_867631 [Obelidium mucronatum]|nr:hypothetical protein BDR26DRAFT_867631 [Obelidium mucronatum]